MLKGGDTRNSGLRGARRVDHLASLGEHFCLEPYEWNRGTWQGAPSSGILFCIMLHYLMCEHDEEIQEDQMGRLRPTVPTAVTATTAIDRDGGLMPSLKGQY